MTLRYRLENLITIDNVNGNVSFDAVGSLPSEVNRIDIAVEGFANFISGNYIQSSSNVDNYISSVSIDKTAVQKAAYRLVESNSSTRLPNSGGMAFTTYGDSIRTQGSRLVAKAINGLHGSGTSSLSEVGNYFADLEGYNGALASVVTTNTDTGSRKLNFQEGGLGPVLLQTVSAALFKSLGKTAAIVNDQSIADKEDELSNSIKGAWNETNASLSDTLYLPRYIDSGRFYGDAVVNTGTKVDYNFNDATFDFIVQLKGSLSDSGGDPVPINSTTISRVFGTTGSDTKVNGDDNGSYTMNMYIRLHQVDELEN